MIQLRTRYNSYNNEYSKTTTRLYNNRYKDTKRLTNHVLVCAGIKEIQNKMTINTSSQACSQ
jgi:hypothetical protein